MPALTASVDSDDAVEAAPGGPPLQTVTVLHNGRRLQVPLTGTATAGEGGADSGASAALYDEGNYAVHFSFGHRITLF